MTDREKVIKGLEEISDYFFDIYRNDTDGYKCEKAQEYSNVAIDAIALLKKEQEAKPIIYTDNPYTKLPVAHCPKCGKFARQFHTEHPGEETKYCPWCGQLLKWEEDDA